jgi:hypothetical protein
MGIGHKGGRTEVPKSRKAVGKRTKNQKTKIKRKRK